MSTIHRTPKDTTAGDERRLDMRCEECGRLLYVKLTRDPEDRIVRESYCSNPDCHLQHVPDVTTTAGRRALRVAAAARVLTQGAA